mmetsp:Transcript_76682/g.135911  ORF Transcript_76682/g.135911 Transcript_76682/m.135911 type:complete len:637 (+) Transcript_76682:45-1955(+)
MLWSIVVSLFSLAVLPSWVVLRVRVLLKNEHSHVWNDEGKAALVELQSSGMLPPESLRTQLPHAREAWSMKWGEQHKMLYPHDIASHAPGGHRQSVSDVGMGRLGTSDDSPGGDWIAVPKDTRQTRAEYVKHSGLAGMQKMAVLALALLIPGLSSSAALHCFLWGCPGTQQNLVPTPTSRALGACFFLVFIDHALVSALIPDNLSLATTIHASTSFSGVLFAAYVCSTALGYVLVWLLNAVWPHFSIVQMRPLLTGSVITIGVGMNLFAGTLVLLESAWVADDVAAVLLTFGRSLAGIGTGVQLFTTRVFAIRVASQAEQPACNALYTFYLMLGVGVGPIAGAFCQEVLALVGTSVEVRLVSVMGMNLSVCAAMISACWGFPQYEEIDILPEAQQILTSSSGTAQGQSQQQLEKRKLVICCIIFVVGVRGTAVAGLEVATSMILERDFGWSSNQIGWVISLSYLACIPQRKLYEKLKCTMSTVYWIRLLMATSVVGSVLLVESLADGLLPGPEGRAFLLVVADVLLIPSLMLVDALLEGIAFSLSIPNSSDFSLNQLVLYTRLAVNFLGSLAGPSFSRGLLNVSGQDGYALQQLMLTLSIFFVVEIGILGSELEGISNHFFVNKAVNARLDGSLCL